MGWACDCTAAQVTLSSRPRHKHRKDDAKEDDIENGAKSTCYKCTVQQSKASGAHDEKSKKVLREKDDTEHMQDSKNTCDSQRTAQMKRIAHLLRCACRTLPFERMTQTNCEGAHQA